MRDHESSWAQWESELPFKTGALEGTSWAFVEAVTGNAKVDRQYDLSRIREVGFEEKIDTVEGYHLAFDRMRKAKIIP